MFQYDVPPKTGHRSPLCLQMFITLYFKKKILSISSKKHKYEAIFSLLVIKPSTSCFCFLQALIILISISISSACMLIHSLSCLCLLSKEKYLARLMKTILCSQVLSLVLYPDDVMIKFYQLRKRQQNSRITEWFGWKGL